MPHIPRYHTHSIRHHLEAHSAEIDRQVREAIAAFESKSGRADSGDTALPGRVFTGDAGQRNTVPPTYPDESGGLSGPPGE
jgi:hypothetical protein